VSTDDEENLSYTERMLTTVAHRLEGLTTLVSNFFSSLSEKAARNETRRVNHNHSLFTSSDK